VYIKFRLTPSILASVLHCVTGHRMMRVGLSPGMDDYSKDSSGNTPWRRC
jgi:hypothetical protein